jgi:putative membrane protein
LFFDHATMSTSPDAPQQPEPRSFADWWRLGVNTELCLFRRPMVALSALAIVMVPSLYAVFYISSFWDPYGHLDRMPAALVNNDRGATRGGRTVNLGNTVVDTFEQQPPFHFVRKESAEAADEALQRGEVYFELIIPSDFSERALAARQDTTANFTLRVAEGANYTSAIISKRFGAELAHTLNEKLNRERWAAIAGDPAAATNVSVRAAIGQLRDGAQHVQEGSGQLDDGLGRAADGSRRLTDGAGQMADAAVSLSDGMGKVAAGVQEMRDRLPPPEKLQELADGSKAAVGGEEKLAAGIDELSAGQKKLDDGAGQLRLGAAKVPLFGGKLSAGAGQLQDGIEQLGTGLTQAAAGGRDLHDGLQKLDGGVQALASGLLELETNLAMMSEKLPTEEQRSRITNGAVELRTHGAELTNGLAQLVDGSRQLAAGSKELSAGLDRLNAGLMEQLGDADAGGLAGSVRANIEITAPVQNNGTAFSPYFSALALWLGGIMMTFIIHFRRIIEPMRAAPRPAKWLAKFTVPMGLGVSQATVVVLVLRLGFGIVFVHPLMAWVAAVLGSFTFVALIQLMVVVLGDAGRLVAVVLLILQLAAAGGIYPVELSGPFYTAIHPYLPLTALVRAFRATMFGAFGGTWSAAALQLAVTGCVAAALAIWLARWKYVPEETYCPAVEFS